MNRWKSIELLSLVLVLAVLAMSPVNAAAPSPWEESEVGAPETPGTTTVDANGNWTVRGSGTNIDGSEESFHFVHQTVQGDGSIIARIPTAPSNASPNQGIMIRENKEATAANQSLVVTTEKLAWKTRLVDSDTTLRTDLAYRYFPVFTRLQRVGNDFTGFVSTDNGMTWKQVSDPTRIAMGESALFGLVVTSRSDALSTGRFTHVNLVRGPAGVSPNNLVAGAGDKSVLLTWNPVPNAAGYNVYRVPSGGLTPGMPALNPEPTANAFYTDNSTDLVNGTATTYAVTPVFKNADGALTEGAASAVTATPNPVPQGFTGSSIIEGTRVGSAALDATTGEITIRGSGYDINYATVMDTLFFLNQPLETDFQITVKTVARPRNGDALAAAGLMLRESLEPGARNLALLVTQGQSLQYQYRGTTRGATDVAEVLDSSTLQLPITLRLTRAGDTITAEYSLDDGKTYEAAGDPYQFEQPLPKRVYVGLSITAHNNAKTAEAKFRDLVVK